MVSLSFFICYLTSPLPPLGHYQRDSLGNSMLTIACLTIFDMNVTGSLLTRLVPALTERVVGIEPESFQFVHN